MVESGLGLPSRHTNDDASSRTNPVPHLFTTGAAPGLGDGQPPVTVSRLAGPIVLRS